MYMYYLITPKNRISEQCVALTCLTVPCPIVYVYGYIFIFLPFSGHNSCGFSFAFGDTDLPDGVGYGWVVRWSWIKFSAGASY